MKFAMWIFAIIGSLGFFDWVVAGIVLEHDPRNRFAQVGASAGMLYISLFFMALGLFFAWLCGVGDGTTSGSETRRRIARHLKLVK